MDPRERAEAALARARARGAYVVTPENAISPMDAAATIQIPRVVVSALDESETTMSLPVIDNVPAIAQEAATQSLAVPPRPVEEPVGGLIPTTKPAHGARPSMAQRLDGGNNHR